MRYFLKRSLAYWIDLMISYAVVMLIIQWVLLNNIRGSLGMTDTWFEQSWNMFFYVAISISLPVWLYFIYFDSRKSKGTFGKRMMRLSVQNWDNQRISLGKSFQRVFLKLLPWEISHAGIIFPTPLYFEDEPSMRWLPVLGLVLFIVYMASILLNRDR